MPANVVTLSVQTGSGGFTVAHRVADRLGFRYYDWEITSEAAARAGVTPNEVIAAERVPGFMERMMRRLGAVSTVSLEGSPGFSELSPAMYNTALESLTSDDYRQFIERVVLELADRGEAVIVGHAAQHTLRKEPGVLRVLVYGSPTIRAERLAAEQGIDVEKAKATIKQSDKDRGELLKRLYRFDWLDAAMYDLAFNTDNLSLDYATEAITTAAREWP
ncbi:MAG TPA: cytidylate kinase-like family protein [Dehalococcoidia bacterium]|nr:cytidylate kinase-like family protein [Dehalococcoidia bacterium]